MMFKLILKRRVTTLIISFQIYFLAIGSSFAAQKVKNQPILAIRTIHAAKNLSNYDIDPVTYKIRKEFEIGQKVKVLSEKKTNTFKLSESDPQRKKGLKELESARNFIKKGKEEFAQYKINEATQSFLNAIEGFSSNMKYLEENSDFITAHIQLAQIFDANNQPEECKRMIETVFVLTNDVALDPNEFPPKFIAKVQEMKKASENYPKSEIKIETKPGEANVYLNGRLIGETLPGTPLVISDIKYGKHNLLIKKEGYEDIFDNNVQINKPEGAISLTMKSKDLSLKFVPITEKSPLKKRVDFLHTFANDPSINCDIVFLGSLDVDSESSTYFIRGQLFDVRNDVYSKSLKTNLGVSLDDIDAKIKKLVAALEKFIDNEGFVTKDPIEPAAQEESVQEAESANENQQEADDSTEEGQEKDLNLPPPPPDEVPQTPEETGSSDDSMDPELMKKKKMAALVLLGIIGAAVGVGLIIYFATSGGGNGKVTIYPPQ